MSSEPQDKTERILDLLLEMLDDHRHAREQGADIAAPYDAVAGSQADSEQLEASLAFDDDVMQRGGAVHEEEQPAVEPDIEPLRNDQSEDSAIPATIRIGDQMHVTIYRLFLALLLVIVFVNLPFFTNAKYRGAEAGDDPAAGLAVDGTLLKGSGYPVYVIESNRRRWITTSEAFEYFGYRWQDVRNVSDSYIERFEEGPPIYLLLKCSESPHIYALSVKQPGSQLNVKRWIRDIPTFESEGFSWDQVQIVACDYLRALPDGQPFPEDAGPSPQP